MVKMTLIKKRPSNLSAKNRYGDFPAYNNEYNNVNKAATMKMIDQALKGQKLKMIIIKSMARILPITKLISNSTEDLIM